MNKKMIRRIRDWLENKRWKFWAHVMERYPRIFAWCDKHLPFDTLPF